MARASRSRQILCLMLEYNIIDNNDNAAADHLDPGEHGREEAHVRAAVRPAAGAEGAGGAPGPAPRPLPPDPLMSQRPAAAGLAAPLPSGALTISVPCVSWNQPSDKPPALGAWPRGPP